MLPRMDRPVRGRAARGDQDPQPGASSALCEALQGNAIAKEKRQKRSGRSLRRVVLVARGRGTTIFGKAFLAMGAATPLRVRDVFLLGCAIVCWGANWTVMKLALGHSTPLWLAALRFMLGAATIFAILAVRGGVRLPPRATFRSSSASACCTCWPTPR